MVRVGSVSKSPRLDVRPDCVVSVTPFENTREMGNYSKKPLTVRNGYGTNLCR